MLKGIASLGGIFVAMIVSTTTFAQAPSGGQEAQPSTGQSEIQAEADAQDVFAERRRHALRLVEGRNGVEQDVAGGIAELEELIAADYAPAMVSLAGYLINGNFVDGNVERAEELLEAAIVLGETSAELPLARLLRNATSNRAPAPERAAELLQNAAPRSAPAARLLAEMQFNGEGLPANPELATASLEQMGADGDANAYQLLANLYLEGANGVPADPQRAVGYFENAVDLDLRIAKRTLGTLLVNGDNGVTPNPVRGLELLDDAADDGDGPSARTYARALIDGADEIRDVPAGIARFESLIAAGDNSSMLELADLYLAGSAIPSDPERAVELLEAAVSNGSTTAMTRLASALRSGTGGIEVDAEASLALYERAAAAGNNAAAIETADMIIRGEGTAADPQAGIARLEQLGAAGRAAPYIYLAEMFLAGDGRVPVDPERAVDYYQAAVDLNHRASARNLASLLIYGEKGVATDPERGFALLDAAIASGDRAALRLRAIAGIEGHGNEQDIANGLADLEGLIADGDAAASLDLASIYLEGEFLPADPQKAQQLLSDAADNGSVAALTRLAELYETGRSGLERDRATAFRLYERAAELGNRNSQRKVAALLLSGQDIPLDVPRAMALYETLGDARELATIYIRGERVPRDVQKGIAILNEGVSRQNAGAAQFLVSAYRTGYGNRVPRNLTRASEILEASRDWLSPTIYHTEAALLAAATATLPGYGRTVDHLRALPPASAVRVFRQIRSVNRNAYVFVAQTRMTEMGLFNGSINGMLGTSTIRAVNALCAAEQRTAECRRGPLSADASLVLSDALYAQK